MIPPPRAAADARLRTALPAVSVPERMHRKINVLLWQVQGATDCTLGGVAHELIAGHALWIPAGVRHALEVRAESVVLPMHLAVDPAPGLLTAPTWVEVDPELRTLMLALVQSQNSIIKPDSDLERQVLRRLHSRTVPPTGLPMPVSPSARAIADTLRRNPADDRSVAELATSRHMSTRTLERAFQTETGTTLREWRIRSRMETAAELLREDLPPAVVAGRVGYGSDAAFRRAFKGCLGVTPGQYARRHRQALEGR